MSEKSPIRRFFSALGRAITWLRLVLVNLVFLLMLAVFYFAFTSARPEPLPPKFALLLNPAGSIVDQKSPVDPVEALLGPPDPTEHEVLLRDVIDAIKTARDDNSVSALVLQLDYLTHAGISRSQEIVPALREFRESGKPIIAVGDYYTQDQYLLASYADEVLMHPLGGVALEGFGVYQNYFADALEKFSVDVHVFRAGEYKSAVEPFMRNDMSPGEKKVALQWLGDLWSAYTGAVEENRRLSAGAVDKYVNGLPARLSASGGDMARDALDAGLVDQLLSRVDANDYIAGKVGARDEDGLYQAVGFEEYLWRHHQLSRLTHASGKRVAVITAEGLMLPGEQPPGTVGGDSLAQLIAEATADDDVAAIVLRVDSPGGSMFAADVIREQILKARDAGLPVVVSMGAVAASGGYYIAAPANEIWATPTTITGSIGVYALFPTVERLLQRGGVHTDGVGTTDLAGSLRLDRPLQPELASALQAGVLHAYDVFKGSVAEGRGMSLEDVDSIAEGRVWSAEDALQVGLVDKLGDLQDAVASAAALAGVKDYQVDYFAEPLSPAQLLLQRLSERVGDAAGLRGRASGLGALSSLTRPLQEAASVVDGLRDPRHLYMRCLACEAFQ